MSEKLVSEQQVYNDLTLFMEDFAEGASHSFVVIALTDSNDSFKSSCAIVAPNTDKQKPPLFELRDGLYTCFAAKATAQWLSSSLSDFSSKLAMLINIAQVMGPEDVATIFENNESPEEILEAFRAFAKEMVDDE